MDLQIDIFTGGLAQTNSFLFETGEGHWLVDAPEGTADYLEEEKIQPQGLILTHGHWDHIWDAAEIIKKTGCQCFAHRDDRKLFQDPNIMAQFGLPVQLEPVAVSRYLDEGEMLTAGSFNFKILHVPGHCPGSIALYEDDQAILFGGDVLFAGGVGRWDLPGGDFDVLMASIRNKVLTLPEQTRVYPGHGPATTVVTEKTTNPFLK